MGFFDYAVKFVLLSSQGLTTELAAAQPHASFLRAMAPATAKKPFRSKTGPKLKMRVHDQVADDGAKLVELDDPATRMALRAEQPSLRLVPVRFYRPALYRPRLAPKVATAAATLAATVQVKIRVISKLDGQLIRNAMVVGFTDFAARQGAQGTTNASGEVKLTFAGSKLQRLYVYPELGFWSVLKRNVTLGPLIEVKATPIDLSVTDCVRHFYGSPQPPALSVGTNVTVGVLDTGVGPHSDLRVDGGACTIIGDTPTDFGDNGENHGTHVGGIIASRGTAPTGVRGIAPGVRLRSYRVFPKQGVADLSPSFAIAKAIHLAVQDGCHLINMSLKLEQDDGSPDPTVQAAVAFANQHGSVVIAAAGNDDRSPVSFPAADALAIAVSAMGRKGTFPRGTTESADVAKPTGTDKNDFLAAFSNVGPELDVTGPGVGVISTVLGGHGVMSGTSMACPAETGRCAAILAQNAALLALPANAARSDAIKQMMLQAASSLGFGPTFEGLGLLP